jgi:hypothetical protein
MSQTDFSSRASVDLVSSRAHPVRSFRPAFVALGTSLCLALDRARCLTRLEGRDYVSNPLSPFKEEAIR